MADIRFYCQACRGKLVVDSAASGHHANCPHCNKRLLIPKESEPRPRSGAASPPPRFPSVETIAGTLTTTQKISDDRTSLSLPPSLRMPASSAPSVPTAFASSTSLPKRPEAPPLARSAGSEVGMTTDARQKLSDLIQGLQRENTELRRQLSAAPPPPSPVADAPELVTLRKELAARDERIASLQAALAAGQSERDGERAVAEKVATERDDEAAKAEALGLRVAAAEAEVLRVDAARAEAQRAAVRAEAEAGTLRVDYASLQEMLERLRTEHGIAVQDRDRYLTDAAHARQRLRITEGALVEESRLKAEAAAAAKGATADLARAMEDVERLTSERSALVVANDELKDRLAEVLAATSQREEDVRRIEALARAGDTLRAELEEARRALSDLVVLRDCNAALEQQAEVLRSDLLVTTKAAAEVAMLRERVTALEEDNRRLLQQVGAKERELRTRAEASNPPIHEAKLLRRIEELESSLRTAEAFARGLKSRIAALEGENVRLQALALPAPAPALAAEVPAPTKRTAPVVEAPPSAPASAPPASASPPPATHPAAALPEAAPPSPTEFSPARREGRSTVAWISGLVAVGVVVGFLWYAGVIGRHGADAGPVPAAESGSGEVAK